MRILLSLMASLAILAASMPADAAVRIETTGRNFQYLATASFIAERNASGRISQSDLTSVRADIGGDFPSVSFGLADLVQFYFNSETDYSFSFVRGDFGYQATASASSMRFRYTPPWTTIPSTVTESFPPGQFNIRVTDIATPAIPEPAGWAMMLLGFGMMGGVIRYRKGVMTARPMLA